MDYIAFCKNFTAATNLPVALTKGDSAIYSSLGEALALPINYHRNYYDDELIHNPGICGDSPDISYGRIKIEGTDYNVFVGPTFSVPPTESLIRQFMHDLSISISQREAVREYLLSIPRIGQFQLARYLVFLHQCLNGISVDVESIISEDVWQTEKRVAQHTDQMLQAQENAERHSTYEFEMQIYHLIKEGNEEKLRQLFKQSMSQLHEGTLASTPLRQAKNIFLTTTTKAGLLGAIPGGVSVEKTYQLIDYYIQECEQLSSMEAIMQLQYLMLLDFCKRSGETQPLEGISPDVWQCMEYIRTHTNESISLEDAASASGRSVSYMVKHFKAELGIQMGAYIMRCKLEEAKSLLSHSNKSLAEISSYLCFSSQAYFQNVFKKQYGMTPLQYRKKTKLPF